MENAVPTAPIGGAHADAQRVLDRAVTDGGVPGILAEIRAGDRCWFGTAGVADTETRQARRPQDRFRIGSVTKTFTATVVLRLAAERRLALDDTVERWLPGVVAGNGHDGSRTTIRQLLNHTSGIFSHTHDQPALSQQESYTPHELVRIAMSHPADFPAGTGWAYSNTNYILAGMIVERVTGRALADEIAERVTGPLGLTGTYLPRGADPTIQGPHSRHYTRLHSPDPDAETYDVTDMETSVYWAAGGMISTAGDLNRFFAALLGGQLLPPEQQRDMLTTTPTQNWLPHSTYGLGISTVTLPSGATVWGMGGAIFGSWSYAYGTRDGEHLVTTNINGDWTTGGWDDPIGIFTDLLDTEFRPSGSLPA
ncbi:serine hydrolase domain-containing protein [Streptoalloteichus hindustanus]|uniref:D-alanyl-D-alanine carboxypeptidase n=1 Tax=Streptoalloteichus hindustanus TaxID=2017 RepID=A0A1M5HY39_STRHI|nr:serine hydrolase domain-containing protein [Streptoalloteichus hindustanus]SHG20807.1 D-alanyl-D-alanine carboxypeptidase [Streptoalloteichus hindustanus]